MPEMPKIEVRARQIRGRGAPGSSFCARRFSGRPERAAVRGNLRVNGHEELDPFNGEGGWGGGRHLFCWS